MAVDILQVAGSLFDAHILLNWTNIECNSTDSPYHYPVTIHLEPVESEPANGEEMFVARCEHFPELAMAEESPGKAYDGLICDD